MLSWRVCGGRICYPLADTKRPIFYWLVLGYLLNNSRVTEVHVSGATCEGTFLSILPLHLFSLFGGVLITFIISVKRMSGGGCGVSAGQRLAEARNPLASSSLLPTCSDWRNMLFGRSARRQSHRESRFLPSLRKI